MHASEDSLIGSEPIRGVYELRVRGEMCVLGRRTWLMGVLNVTPDSFWDGSRRGVDAAVARGLELFGQGADIVDIGGESTRPQSTRSVSAEEETRRVVPAIEELRRRGAGPISIDTSKALVARAALDAGADWINDISGFGFDGDMPRVAADSGAPVVLMHLRGDFTSMHDEPSYESVVPEVTEELEASVERAVAAGVARGQILVDPGIGFAKRAPHSLEVLGDLGALRALDRPILVGPSRKSFIGQVLDLPVESRLMGTAAAVAASVLGGAHVVRVHDVAEMREVVRVCDALLETRAA